MTAFRPFHRPRICPRLVLPVLLYSSALLEAQTTATAGPPPEYEPGLMLLTVTGILICGGLTLRLLMRIGLIKRLVWLLPILIAATAAVLVGLRVAHLHTVYANLFSLVRFLFVFLIFASTLYPIARLVMPSNAMRTRAGVPPLLRGLAVGIVTFIGMFVLLNWFFPRLSLTPMFVTSGVVSIVVGLAIQEPLSNLLAGILMSVERPFRVGDWIRINGLEGKVVIITWRATRLRTRENDYVLIPNSIIAKESLVNFGRPSPVHMLKITVSVAYETPCALVNKALLEAAQSVGSVLRNPPPSAHLRDFADSAQIYELRLWIDNYESAPAIESDVRQHIWYTFRRYDITIPFPQQDVYLKRVPKKPAVEQARITCINGPLRNEIFEIPASGLLIGRSDDCDVLVPDPRISHRHARIEPAQEGYRLVDLDSRHGTQLNGKGISVADLRSGDRIAVDAIEFIFESNRTENNRQILEPAKENHQGTTGTSEEPDSETTRI